MATGVSNLTQQSKFVAETWGEKHFPSVFTLIPDGWEQVVQALPEKLVAVEIGTKIINSLTDVDDESMMMMMAALT